MPRPIDEFIDDSQSDGEVINEPLIRKRKKRDKRRHRKRKKQIAWESMSVEEESVTEDNYPSVADDIKECSNATFPESDGYCSDDEKSKSVNVSPRSTRKRKQKTKDSSDGSSEEERWLHAIEAGTLEEVDDELKTIKPKDPKLMTARQRAILERKNEKDSPIEPPTVAQTENADKQDTAALQKNEERLRKIQRRKQLADKKRENDKKKTMEKLLRKNENKNARYGPKVKPKKTYPCAVYTNSKESISIKLPDGYEFPLKAKKSNPPPAIQKCGVSGCNNDKKYTCSKTSVPLCSLECYKLNLSQNGIKC